MRLLCFLLHTLERLCHCWLWFWLWFPLLYCGMNRFKVFTKPHYIIHQQVPVEYPHICTYQLVLYAVHCSVNICSSNWQDVKWSKPFIKCLVNSSVAWIELQIICATIAILLHYFFLTTFMWMLMEGVVLYIVLVKVFTQVNWKYYTGFTLLCYGKTVCIHIHLVMCTHTGGPLVYMALCVPLGLARRDEWSYGTDDL